MHPLCSSKTVLQPKIVAISAAVAFKKNLTRKREQNIIYSLWQMMKSYKVWDAAARKSAEREAFFIAFFWPEALLCTTRIFTKKSLQCLSNLLGVPAFLSSVRLTILNRKYTGSYFKKRPEGTLNTFRLTSGLLPYLCSPNWALECWVDLIGTPWFISRFLGRKYHAKSN